MKISIAILVTTLACAPFEGVLRAEPPAAPSTPYDGVRSSVSVWMYLVSASDGSARIRRIRTAVCSDGRFGSVVTESAEEKAGVAEVRTYFVFGNPTAIWCSVAEGSRYIESTLEPKRGPTPGPAQAGHAPWALVGQWVREMPPANDGVGAPGSHVLDLALPGSKRRYSITLSSRGELVSRETYTSDERSRWEYSGFHDVDGIPIPASLHEVVTAQGPEGPRVVSESVATLESCVINPPDIDELVRFDPVKMNVQFLDGASGEVYSPDRTQRMYNVGDFDPSKHGGVEWWRRSWMAGVGVLVVASIWLVRKRTQQPS